MKNKIYEYSDGDNVENFLLELFKSSPSEVEIEKVLIENNSWPILYHLSKDRHNLLSWYTFAPNSNILEIGAGCGAVTGALLRDDTKVTAVELTERRADIIRERFHKRKNLTVLTGNLYEQEIEEKFDYITLIGVLEYAGRFTLGPSPFSTMLYQTKKLLKKEGTLIIAIENRFGLKYWRGAPEDHTNNLFDSLEGYPNYDGIRTFGREEIADLILNTGFKKNNISFYYPIPDYKFPYEIFNESYLVNNKQLISGSLYPSPHPTENHLLFNERLVSKGLQKNRIFNHFANSFLIFAKNG